MHLDRIPPSTPFSISDPLRIQAVAQNRQPPGAVGGPGSEGAGDRVEIQASAREVSRARQHVDAAPDVRQARVDALQHQVQAGSYAVDSAHLARKLFGMR